MENKVVFDLCANYSLEDFRSAVNNSFICSFLIDRIRTAIGGYRGEKLNLEDVEKGFALAVDKSRNVSFSSCIDWANNKVEVYNDLLIVLQNLDKVVSDTKIIKNGELIDEVRSALTDFALKLQNANIAVGSIDIGDLPIKHEFVNDFIKEFSLVDEGQFLNDLSTMQLNTVPVEVKKFKNAVIDKKIDKINEIINSVEVGLGNEFDKLHNLVMNSYDKFYKIAYASAMTDGERADEARKIYKDIAPHNGILDKLEDRLTEANELKRQLALNEKKMTTSCEEKINAYQNEINVNPSQQDKIEREIDSLKFVTGDYVARIHAVNRRMEDVKEVISERYKIVERVGNALKFAIPSENEMKRYTSLVIKFRDLCGRLEMGKMQNKTNGKEFVSVMSTAITGMKLLAELALSGRDVYLRNSMLMCVFNSVNGMYDLVDNPNKSIELTEIKYVTTRLVQYSTLNNIFNKNLVAFRNLANDTIRDIAMIMGKPFTIESSLEIVDAISVASEKMQQLVDVLDKNNVKQCELLDEILNV